MLIQVSDTFPFEWIKKKWKEGFHVTSIATAGSQWAVVMSRGTSYLNQVGTMTMATACICTLGLLQPAFSTCAQVWTIWLQMCLPDYNKEGLRMIVSVDGMHRAFER